MVFHILTILKCEIGDPTFWNKTLISKIVEMLNWTNIYTKKEEKFHWFLHGNLYYILRRMLSSVCVKYESRQNNETMSLLLFFVNVQNWTFLDCFFFKFFICWNSYRKPRFRKETEVRNISNYLTSFYSNSCCFYCIRIVTCFQCLNHNEKLF